MSDTTPTDTTDTTEPSTGASRALSGGLVAVSGTGLGAVALIQTVGAWAWWLIPVPVATAAVAYVVRRRRAKTGRTRGPGRRARTTFPTPRRGPRSRRATSAGIRSRRARTTGTAFTPRRTRRTNTTPSGTRSRRTRGTSTRSRTGAHTVRSPRRERRTNARLATRHTSPRARRVNTTAPRVRSHRPARFTPTRAWRSIFPSARGGWLTLVIPIRLTAALAAALWRTAVATVKAVRWAAPRTWRGSVRAVWAIGDAFAYVVGGRDIHRRAWRVTRRFAAGCRRIAVLAAATTWRYLRRAARATANTIGGWAARARRKAGGPWRALLLHWLSQMERPHIVIDGEVLDTFTGEGVDLPSVIVEPFTYVPTAPPTRAYAAHPWIGVTHDMHHKLENVKNALEGVQFADNVVLLEFDSIVRSLPGVLDAVAEMLGRMRELSTEGMPGGVVSTFAEMGDTYHEAEGNMRAFADSLRPLNDRLRAELSEAFELIESEHVNATALDVGANRDYA